MNYLLFQDLEILKNKYESEISNLEFQLDKLKSNKYKSDDYTFNKEKEPLENLLSDYKESFDKINEILTK